MRRCLSFVMAVLVSAFLVTNSYAAQDQSFTKINSAGMFEDVYDYFKYSPAYLPSFQKTTLWTQLSNLFNTNDELFDLYTNNGYFLLGGQTDLMGLGRIGAMVDWDSDIIPQTVTDKNGNPSLGTPGHASSTVVSYLDTGSPGDSIIDTKVVSTAEIEMYDNIMHKNIYAGYGIGNFMGFDIGASIRADLNGYSSSYNPGISIIDPPSLKETYESRATSLLSGVDTSLETFERSGKLDYGSARYDLTFGARSKGLVPDLDLIVNVGGILESVGNDYEYLYERTVDTDLSNPTTKFYEKEFESGIEPYYGYYPGTGLGGLLQVRGDYQLTANILIIGEAMFDIVGRGVSDAKQERESIDRDITQPGANVYTDETVNTTIDSYEGSVNAMGLGLGVRALYQGAGWRLGMGLRASTRSSTSEITTESETNNVITDAGRPLPVNNYVQTTSSALTSITKTRSVSDRIELPVGLQIDILDNLPIYFGSSHVVTFNENTSSYEVTDRSLSTTTIVYGDGSASTSTSEVNNADDATNDSSLSSNHNTYFYYGLTWWPKENIQIDLKNVFDSAYPWRDLDLSVTMHF